MILNFKNRELHIEMKEKQIQAEKEKFVKRANTVLRTQEKINKKLSNGVIIKLYTATGHNHG